MSKVDHLWLYSTPIDDAGLAFLPKLKSLSAIHLASTKITDAGLMELRRFPALREVHVESTKVTSSGLVRFHESLPDCTFYADPSALEEYCTSVLSKEPDNFALYKQRGETRARYQQKWSEAAEDLAKVIKLEPDDVDSWHHRTMLLVKLQQKDLLYEHLAKMLARFQDNSGGNTGILIHSLSTFPTGRPELIQAGEVLAGKLPNDPKWRSNVAFAALLGRRVR